MPASLEDLVMVQPPTADRPLLGTMILVVEDSRHACEAVRLICQRSGARIRRAANLASTERHLCSYRPRIAVVDLGLPDGSGLELIARMSQSDSRIEGIIATSGDESLKDAAIQAGADVFLPKPLASVSLFQNTVLSLLPPDCRPSRVSRPNSDEVLPDAIALRDDLALAADLLRDGADRTVLIYVSAFLLGLAKCADRPRIAEIAETIQDLSLQEYDPVAVDTVTLAILDEATALEPV